MLRLPASNAYAGALEAPATPSNGRILSRCSRWTNRPSLLATMTARPHHTVQLWRLWITVEMWTRCVCLQLVFRIVSHVNIGHGILPEGAHGQSRSADCGERGRSA